MKRVSVSVGRLLRWLAIAVIVLATAGQIVSNLTPFGSSWRVRRDPDARGLVNTAAYQLLLYAGTCEVREEQGWFGNPGQAAVEFNPPHGLPAFGSGPRVARAHFDEQLGVSDYWFGDGISAEPFVAESGLFALGSSYKTGGGNHTEARYAACPIGLLIAIPAVGLIVDAAARQVRRRRRTCMGSCVRCGYDLRATPGRCPECGAAVPTREPADRGPS